MSSDPYHDTDLARRENCQGLKSVRHGKLDHAEAAFSRALAADVTFAPAHQNLGTVYFLTGRYYLAAWEYEYASRIMPEDPKPYSSLGLVYEEVEKPDDAVVYHQMAHELDPMQHEYLANLVRAKIRRGDRDESTRMLLKELVFRDPRPDWNAWAREELALSDDGAIQDNNAAPNAPAYELLPLPDQPLPLNWSESGDAVSPAVIAPTAYYGPIAPREFQCPTSESPHALGTILPRRLPPVSQMPSP